VYLRIKVQNCADKGLSSGKLLHGRQREERYEPASVDAVSWVGVACFPKTAAGYNSEGQAEGFGGRFALIASTARFWRHRIVWGPATFQDPLKRSKDHGT
jgi:hypothetical protein